MLLNTAYSADLWMASLEVGSSLYNSLRVLSAILWVYSLFFSLSSFAKHVLVDKNATARITEIILNFISGFPNRCKKFAAGPYLVSMSDVANLFSKRLWEQLGFCLVPPCPGFGD